MKKKILIIFIFLSLSPKIFSQISFGINLEPFVPNGDAGKEGISLLGISTSIGYRFDSTKSIYVKTGFYANDFNFRHFAGSNYSILGIYQFNKSLYGLVDLSIYKNDAKSGLGTRITNHSIFLLGLGIGTNLLTWLRLENILYLPVSNNEFSTIYSLASDPISLKLTYMFKFVLGIKFDL